MEGQGEPASGARRSGFTLLEILVVMALLSFIVLGLMAMFNQTQKAFRAGLLQTDILEAGRLATDLLGRELEGVTPVNLRTNYTPALYAGISFYVEAVSSSRQSLPSSGGNMWRTNILDDLFFMSRENQIWTGTGYFVRTNRALGAGPGPVCTLYRYEASQTADGFRQNPSLLFAGFNYARGMTNDLSSTNVSRIIDGVVHFRIRPHDTDGWLIPFNPVWRRPYTNYPSAVRSTNLFWQPDPYPKPDPPDPMPNQALGEFTQYVFVSNAVPAFVEFELGVLEEQTLQRYNSLPAAERRADYLQDQAGRVHLFRQRVAVRNVDPSAYQ
jgi:prepilin-type N-terminal cleavage/methylation domain-containing protein